MDYARKLAKRVLKRKPRSPLESARALNDVLEEEGYSDADYIILAELKRDVANAAREILNRPKEKVS